MKHRLFTLITCCSLLGALFTSCAKDETESIDVQRERSFDAWMSLYGDGAEKLSTGIYVKKLRTATDPDAKSPTQYETDTCWVRINYTSYGMTSGEVFATRDSVVAKHEGTFTYYTNYIPDYVPFTPYGSILFSSDVAITTGCYLALGNMKEGDLWRVYIPQSMAYGDNGYSYAYSGFGGQNSLGANLPIIMDLELVEVVQDPAGMERQQVQTYAMNHMGKSLLDTLKTNVYLQTLKPSTDPDKPDSDSVVNVYYVGRFLDGFVFDTNVEDTAKKHNLYQYFESSHYDQLSVTLASSDEGTTASSSSTMPGFEVALLNMHYGESARVIFTSTNAYGSLGYFPSYSATSIGSPIIPPYTPLIFDIEMAPHYGNGSKKFPYTTYAVQHQLKDMDGVWVTGYICGVVTGENASESVFTLADAQEAGVKGNILVSSTNSTTNYAICFPVELPEGKVQNALNVVDNYNTTFHNQIKVFGDIRTYKGVRGVTNVTDYVIL